MITAAAYARYEQVGDRVYRVIVTLTDSVRGQYEAGFTASGASVLDLRDDVSRQIAALNTREAVKTALDGIASGAAIPVTAPVNTPTAAEVWVEKARRLATARAMGTLTGTVATDIAALATDVQNTYVAGYLGLL